MTAKRFKLGYVCGDFGLIDNDEWIDLHSMSENSEKNVQICINKMNELAEENNQLKTFLESLREELSLADRDNTALEKENEQLQQELFESEKECIMIDYRDNPIRRNDKIIDLKEEYKERFGRDFE